MKASICPDCGSDLCETWDGSGCANCGFYFDHEHITDEEQRRLESIREEWEGGR